MNIKKIFDFIGLTDDQPAEQANEFASEHYARQTTYTPGGQQKKSGPTYGGSSSARNTGSRPVRPGSNRPQSRPANQSSAARPQRRQNAEPDRHAGMGATSFRGRPSARPERPSSQRPVQAKNITKLFRVQTLGQCGPLIQDFVLGYTLLITITTMDEREKMRIFDTMSGAAFALNGRYQKVSGNTYCALPKGATIEECTPTASGAFRPEDEFDGFQEDY